MDIKLKRHYKAIILFIFTIFFFGLVIGETMMVPYSSGTQLKVSANPDNIENGIYIFDGSLVHEIEIDMTEEDYDLMVTTFNETGEKEYFPADITIDGVTIKNVGLRLKGNSSLNGLFKKNSTSQDTQAPYLIKLDKYVDGQSYQGYTEIAVRTGSFNGGEVSLLEEPLSLFIYQESGQIVPEYSYASVKVSDNKAYYYVICENIDGNYIEKHFADTNGILYKKGNSADFSYKGEDQTKYVSEYEQKTNKKNEDYTKLIAFLKFVSESSDEEFEKELPDWLELDSFMTMIAINELIDNQDSFSGQSRNFYLYYNPETEQFTMLAWDFNLAFGGFGRGGNKGMQGMDGNMTFQTPSEMPPMDFNMSAQKPQGMTNRDINRSIIRPEETPGMDFNRTAQIPGDIENMRQGGGMQGTNELKERFFANEKFSQMYQERYDQLSKKIYCEESLLEEIDYIAKVFTEYNEENNILDQKTYDAEIQKMIDYVYQKRESFCQ
jgi:spore coat protein CotH